MDGQCLNRSVARLAGGVPDPGRVRSALEQLVYLDDSHHVRACDVIELLQRAGIRVFVTGGAPRDWLLGNTSNDIDLSIDRPVAEAETLLRGEYSGIDPIIMRNSRYGVFRWGQAPSGLDINILRSCEDIRECGMWETVFTARADLSDDALTRDFSINAFYYDCQRFEMLDPLGCGMKDLQERRLRLISHPRVLESGFRMTFRILQFLTRGYHPTQNVVEYLRCYSDRDVQGMGRRIHQWIPNHFQEQRSLAMFKCLAYEHARQPASIEVLNSFFG